MILINLLTKLRSEINKILTIFLNRRIFAYVFFPTLIIILYHSYLGHNFINEDFLFIEGVNKHFNPYITFVVHFFRGYFYRPITQDIFYGISYALFGLNPVGYRIIIFVLFIANNYFVYEIANSLTKRKDVAFFTALLYATRGVHSIALYWIPAGFQETGMTFFVLGTIFLYLQYTNNENNLFYVSSLICSILAFMSKETSIILPVLICLLEIYTQISKKHFNLKILMRRIIPFFIVLLLYMVRILRIVVPVFVSYYRTEVSLSVGFKHLLLYTSHAFNTHLEMFILSIFIPIAFLHVEDRKYALFSIRLLKNQVLRKIF